MHLQAVASAFLIVFLCQHEVLVSAVLGGGSGLLGSQQGLGLGPLVSQLKQGSQGPNLLGQLVDDVSKLLLSEGKSPANAVGISKTLQCAQASNDVKTPAEMSKLLSETNTFYNANYNNIAPNLLGGLGNVVNDAGKTLNSLLG
ncbi:hypothetical protein F3A80_23875 [Salmonella enterica subsp. enterica serovar Typhi]|nr:hypothetical protein [Salmonella enterica subsp. enterica serovar Typhi]NRK56339.1 hypothetical protein [Salmonella enterica subsp. enterica serovar Typhi]NRK65200.1 hypothetical protein [Salmonella enterica subsp. enterica serovar Typhi]NRK96559.1 hypothetical protein [Salmonella enterica subsp. enterica serovar Typhi]NRL01124.1 hypothetical protein [Salmonella enterica subsp. enterica serovar Typhi]